MILTILLFVVIICFNIYFLKYINNRIDEFHKYDVAIYNINNIVKNQFKYVKNNENELKQLINDTVITMEKLKENINNNNIVRIGNITTDVKTLILNHVELDIKGRIRDINDKHYNTNLYIMKIRYDKYKCYVMFVNDNYYNDLSKLYIFNNGKLSHINTCGIINNVNKNAIDYVLIKHKFFVYDYSTYIENPFDIIKNKITMTQTCHAVDSSKNLLSEKTNNLLTKFENCELMIVNANDTEADDMFEIFDEIYRMKQNNYVDYILSK